MLPVDRSHSLISLEELYARYESTLSLDYLTDKGTRALSTFNGNKTLPIHRWFTYKEGFSASLVPWIRERLRIVDSNPLSVLDPFCGVATSLLSLQIDQTQCIHQLTGIEINPFVSWAAQSKLNWWRYDPNKISQQIPTLIKSIKQPFTSRHILPVPELTTLSKPEYFDTNRLQELLYAKCIILESIPLPERDFFLLGWSAILETASNLRKDGRALRFVPKREHEQISKLLELQWNSMLCDITQTRLSLGDGALVPKVEIRTEDGRTLPSLRLCQDEYDLIVYSPPYPNNIDYTEVYKVELWLNGFITTNTEFRELRHKTLRSHPAVKFSDTNYLTALDSAQWAVRLRDALIEVVPDNEDLKWRRRLINGYAEDMFVALGNQYRLLKNGGSVVCVVGNSIHGPADSEFCIASDLLISALAEAVGFQVDELVVAREFTRRHFSSPYNRESMIFLSKM